MQNSFSTIGTIAVHKTTFTGKVLFMLFLIPIWILAIWLSPYTNIFFVVAIVLTTALLYFYKKNQAFSYQAISFHPNYFTIHFTQRNDDTINYKDITEVHCQDNNPVKIYYKVDDSKKYFYLTELENRTEVDFLKFLKEIKIPFTGTPLQRIFLQDSVIDS